MRHATQMDGSRHIYECEMSHIHMSHVARTIMAVDGKGTMRHAVRMNESYRTYKQVRPNTRMRHVTHKRVTSDIQMSDVTHTETQTDRQTDQTDRQTHTHTITAVGGDPEKVILHLFKNLCLSGERLVPV